MSEISDTNTILMTAILSMDVYNRDSSPGASSPEVRSRLDPEVLGNAVLVSSEYYPGIEFGAEAWDYDGKIIISYRGTLTQNIGVFAKDAFYGYGVGAGSPYGPQAAAAIEYYQSVVKVADNYGHTGIILTGHSLGGGLAGLVGAIYQQQGEIFNNMPFEAAAALAYRASIGYVAGRTYVPANQSFSNFIYGSGQTPYPNDISGLSGYHTTGEILVPLRASQVTPSIPLLADTQGAAGVSPIDYHSQALLVMALWAQDQAQPLTAWKSVSSNFLSALFTSEASNIANAIGLTGGSSDMMTEIAYSALATVSPGELPFGSSALPSLFADADTLGQMKTDGDFTGTLSDTSPAQGSSELGGYVGSGTTPAPVDAIMEIAVQFAGDQATQAGTSPSSAQGALKNTNGVLTANLDPTLWAATYGNDGQDRIVGASDLVQGVLYNVLGVSASTTVASVQAANAINNFIKDDSPSEIDIALTSSASIDSTQTATVSNNSETPNTIAIGQKDSGSIKAGNGDNLIFGGQTVKVGNGDNIIIGEAGGETITVGGGSNVVIGAGSGNTINIEASQPSQDGDGPGINFVYAGTGSDTVNIDSQNGKAGFIILPVTNFSVNALLDLDQSKLIDAINSKEFPQNQSIFDEQYSNGLSTFDWTVILTPTTDPTQLTLDINGAPINKVIGPGEPNPTPLDPSSPSPVPSTPFQYGGQSYGSIFTIEKGALYIDDFGAQSSELSLTQYLTKAAPLNALPNLVSHQTLADFIRPDVVPDDGDTSAVTVSEFLANQGALDSSFGGFSISDSAANVSAAIDAIGSDGSVNSITLTDTGTPTLSLDAAQALSSPALNEITNAAYTIAITDNAADVSADLDSLDVDPLVTSITLTDTGTPNLTLGVEQALGDTTALGEITNADYTIGIEDDAADVSQAIDALNADSKISSITLSDDGTPTLNLSASQALNDTTALGEITNATYAVSVTDSVATVLADAAALSSDTSVTSLTVVDSVANILGSESALEADSQITGIAVVDTASNVLANESALQADPQITSVLVVDTASNVLGNQSALDADKQLSGIVVEDTATAILANASALAGESKITEQIVSDTAANILANLDALNADNAIATIEISDAGSPTLTVTCAQALGDTTAISELTGPSGVTVEVADTSANVSANLDALNDDSQISGIALTDTGTPTLVLSAGQAINDTTALAEIVTSDYAIAISDSAANVAADIAGLSADAQITSIALTDGGTPTLVLTSGEVIGYATTIAKIDNSDLAIVIQDRASDVAANLDALAGNSQISAITLTDVEAPVLDLSASQVLDDGSALAEISNADFTISVTDTAANILANAASLDANGLVTSINVADSAANILNSDLSGVGPLSSVAVIDDAATISGDLDALSADTAISSITLTGTPELDLTAAQVVNDATALLDISNADYAIAVTDSAANVSAYFDALNSNAQVTSIDLDDSGTPTLTLTAAQATRDTNALDAITNPDYSIAIVDSAADVSSNLDALSQNGQISSIYLTDWQPTLSLTATQVAADAPALEEISNAFSIIVTDTAANVLANSASLAANPNINALNVVDTADNVLAQSAALANDSQITSISVTGSAADISSDVAAINGDTQITSVQVADSVSNVLTNASSLASVSAPLSVRVVDTAANVTAAFDALAADGQVTSITLTDVSAPALNLTAAQLIDDTGLISKIANSNYTIDVTDSASNVAEDIGAIQSDIYGGVPIGSISLTDTGTPTLNLSVFEAIFDQSALEDINTPYAVSVQDNASDVLSFQYSLENDPQVNSVDVLDSSENVAANLDALNSDGQVASITLTDGADLVLTASQVCSDTTALSEITNSDLTIAVVDSAANILADSDQLADDPRIGSVTVSDTAANVLADASDLAADSFISAIDVSDSSASIAANFDALNTDTGVSSIAVTGGASLILSVAQAEDDASALAKVTSSIQISDTVANVLAYDASSSENPRVTAAAVVDSVANVLGNESALSADQSISSIGIVDTAANVSANLDALNQYGMIGTITLTDPGTPALDLDAEQVSNDGAALSKIAGQNYDITLIDTAANVSAYLTSASTGFFGTGLPITALSLTDSGTPTLTLSFLNAYIFARDVTNPDFNVEISDNAADILTYTPYFGYVPQISGVVVNDTATNIVNKSSALASDTSISAVNVVDTAANIASQFDALNSDSQITGITLTDGSLSQQTPAELSISASQIENDGVALGKIDNSRFSLSASNATISLGSNDALTVGGTDNTYLFSAGGGESEIGAGDGSNTGSVDFGGSATPENLWFQQVGNNLQIDLMGTRDALTVDNWFGGTTAAAVQSFAASDGSKLDSQVGQLVSAMATFSANNPSFDPTQVSHVPSDGSLQTALAAAWHS